MKIARPPHDTPPPWTNTFTEIALRAITRLHFDYLQWSLPQTWNRENDISLLNNGPGVAFADEITVCSSISREFMASRIVSGNWISENLECDIKEGQRFYRISREMKYPTTQERADFCIERVDPTTNNPIGSRRVFIEAKRAFRWTTNLGNMYAPTVTSLKSEIREDIRKLREASAAANGLQAFRGYILIWNITDTTVPTNVSPNDFLDQCVNEDSVLWQVRNAPLASSQSTWNETTFVSRWLWIALLEVTPILLGDLSVRGSQQK